MVPPWVVIPIKPLATAKSRLSSILSIEDRQKLVLSLFQNTITKLNQWDQIGGILVVSADTTYKNHIVDPGITFLKENQASGLNASIRLAANYLIARSIESMLVIHADMPFLNQKDLDLFLCKKTVPGLTIASDHHGTGTNVMLVSPPDLIPFSYGENSYQHHIQSAQKIGVPVNSFFSEALAFDIDLPVDLMRLSQEDSLINQLNLSFLHEI